MRPGTAEGSTQTQDQVGIEQVIYLQDFPQTKEDMQALIDIGFNRLNSLNTIEEIWNREIEDETDDVDPAVEAAKKAEEAAKLAAEKMARSHQSFKSGTSAKSQAADAALVETGPTEKLFNKMAERVVVFESAIEINRILKS